MMGMIPSCLMPYARAVKWSLRRRAAERRANAGPVPALPPVAFVIGCGRSGTTVLGHILCEHTSIRYFFEPYDCWAAIDRRNDVIQTFHRCDADLFRGAEAADEKSRQRFARLFQLDDSRQQLLIEKTPFNAYRIGYLEGLAPGSRFVHIVRDGVNVSRSIGRLATTNLYRIAGKPNLNQWWGVDHYKWRAMARDGKAAGYFADEVDTLTTDEQKGAYEWITSLMEVDRWRDRLGDRLFEFQYESLTRDPRGELIRLCGFLGVGAPDDWLKGAENELEPARSNRGEPLRLPPGMCRAFNDFQQRYGYDDRAEPLA